MGVLGVYGGLGLRSLGIQLLAGDAASSRAGWFEWLGPLTFWDIKLGFPRNPQTVNYVFCREANSNGFNLRQLGRAGREARLVGLAVGPLIRPQQLSRMHVSSNTFAFSQSDERVGQISHPSYLARNGF